MTWDISSGVLNFIWQTHCKLHYMMHFGMTWCISTRRDAFRHDMMHFGMTWCISRWRQSQGLWTTWGPSHLHDLGKSLSRKHAKPSPSHTSTTCSCWENRNEAFTAYINAAQRVFHQVTNNDNKASDPDFLHDIARHLEDIQYSLTILGPNRNQEIQRMIEIILEMRSIIDTVIQRLEVTDVIADQCQGQRGRPKLVICENQLIFLRTFGFTWTQIQNILGVSRSRLIRRRNELGLDEGEKFSMIVYLTYRCAFIKKARNLILGVCVSKLSD